MTEFNNGDGDPYGIGEPTPLIDDRPRYRWSWKRGYWYVPCCIPCEVLDELRRRAIARAEFYMPESDGTGKHYGYQAVS